MTQRLARDLACDAAARPDVLHHELDNIADHTRLIMTSFKYHPRRLPSKCLLCGNPKEQRAVRAAPRAAELICGASSAPSLAGPRNAVPAYTAAYITCLTFWCSVSAHRIVEHLMYFIGSSPMFVNAVPVVHKSSFAVRTLTWVADQCPRRARY